jgi:capsular polysaccharide biosynthesis protein
MSQQALDLRSSVKIVRRHKVLVGFAVALGILLGVGYGVLNPPMFTSTALVLLPPPANAAALANAAPDSFVQTEIVIAGSSPVLSNALPDVRPVVSLAELRGEVQISSVTSYIISFTAGGKRAADAEATANAVARSYIAYVTPANGPVGQVLATLIQPAANATGRGWLETLIIDGLIGALAGGLIGVVVALAISRNDKRLKERDEMANAIGVPVLASIPASRPTDAAGWTRLFEDYKPGVVHAWRLRKALQQLGVSVRAPGIADHGTRSAIGVLSVASDPEALALGPQLAVFAASLGIPTALLVGPQQDANITATLRTACAVPPPASSKRAAQLRVTVNDDGGPDVPPGAALIVVVMVVDGQAPRMPDTIRTTAAVLGVSAGGATAEQLARAAVSAAVSGHEIVGILVANPESTDNTTGQIPQLAQPMRNRLPTRLSGRTTEIRR